MNIILNSISATAAFLLGVGIIYILLDTTVGRLKILQSRFAWYGIPVKDYALIAISVFTILSWVPFVLPY
jgi:hypothetical protein